MRTIKYVIRENMSLYYRDCHVTVHTIHVVIIVKSVVLDTIRNHGNRAILEEDVKVCLFLGGDVGLLFLVTLLRIVIFFSGSIQHLMSCDIIFNG